MLRVSDDSIVLNLWSVDAKIIGHAINEVVNGVHIPDEEYVARIGAERESVRALHSKPRDEFNRAELLVLQRTLREVCFGDIAEFEFHARLYGSREQVVDLATRLTDYLHKSWSEETPQIKISPPAFDSANEDDRRLAIIEVSAAKDKAHLPDLLALLKTDTYANRRHIARALGNIGGPDAEASLLELLQSEEGIILGDVARAVGKLRIAEATEALQKLANHEVNWVRFGACEALRAISS